MKKLLVLLLLLLCVARAETPVDPLRRHLGDITLEVAGREVLALNNKGVVWRHQEPVEFKYIGLEVLEEHVVVTGLLQGQPHGIRSVLLTLQGEEVARSSGRMLLSEDGHFYFEDWPAKSEALQHSGIRDIQVLHVNTKTSQQKRWTVKAPDLPDHCLDMEYQAALRFVGRTAGTWQFQYFTSKCQVLVEFQEEVKVLRILEVKPIERNRNSGNHLPLFTYPLLLIPVLVMRKGGWLWAVVLTLLMAFAAREAAYFQLFFYPPFLFPLMVWALIILLVSVWKKWRKRPVNRWLTGAALSTWITFICLWISVTPLDCRGEWWC